MNENDEYKYFSFRLSKVTINDFCRSVQTAKVAEKIIGRFGVEFYIAGFESVDFCVGLTSPMIPPSFKMEFLRFQFVPIEEGRLRVNVRYSNHDIESRRDYLAGLFRAIAKDWTEAREEINKAIAELTGQPAADMDAEKSKPKPKGRYRLTQEEMKARKDIVKRAVKMKAENPRMYWKEIAKELNIPETTLRHYRHEYYT